MPPPTEDYLIAEVAWNRAPLLLAADAGAGIVPRKLVAGA